MRLQLTLSWRLAILVGLTTLVGMVISLIINHQSLSGFDEVVEDAMVVRTTERASVLGKELKGLLTDPDKVQARLTMLTEREEQIFALYLLDVTNETIATAGANIDVPLVLDRIDQLDKPGNTPVGDLVVAHVPLTEKNQVEISARLLVVESKNKLGASSHVIFLRELIIMLLCVAATASVAFLFGRRFAQPILEITRATQRMAEGKIERFELTSPDSSVETKQLATSVEQLAETFKQQVQDIQEVIEDITSSSKDAKAAMSHLASAAAEQAAAVSETASTVEEMEQAGKNAAGNAHEIVEASSRTTEVSIRGRQAVETTSKIILQIKESSQEISAKSRDLLASVEEIGNIIASVNAIAEQSKILAVNASIEAAKAGEYGVGFAVVAQEVKELAQQSKEATLEITGTLTAIRGAIELMVDTAQHGAKQTESGVKMVGNAGSIVNDLSDAIRENSDFANVIATNVNQQSLGLTQIAAAIDQINSTALENQEITKKVEDGTKGLGQSLDRLNEIISIWHTSGPRGVAAS